MIGKGLGTFLCDWYGEQCSREIAPADFGGMEAFRVWVREEFEHCLLI